MNIDGKSDALIFDAAGLNLCEYNDMQISFITDMSGLIHA